ncbi:NAD(P)-dependent oxidoreductase [Sphingobium sp.]|uniref:NAD-dependent epimerase/dehydratase family protein n=1 Tax=Sphingobium sp. TaxID=1912891 RepID=UPI002BAE709A|nr:NAD(P)-dependent oxidoreductase [Sphingobium sp.]HUD93630.1 NAD(P)-dependent oxidoreductase [Sphingobium sp.]
MPENVLVTGGGGFIGSYLAAEHIAAGDEVHILVRPRHQLRPDRLVNGAIVHRVELSDTIAVEQCLGEVRPTILYHLGTSTGRTHQTPSPCDWPALTMDILNLLTLLSAASRVDSLRTLVRTGSLAEYGDDPRQQHEDAREQPHNPYTLALTAGAHYAAALQPQLHFRVLTARLGLTYGVGQSEEFLLPWLIRRCLDGEASELRSPESLRDMLAVKDCVDGLRTVATSALPGGTIVNLCTGRLLSVRAMAETVLAATSAAPTLVHYPTGSSTPAKINIVGGDPARAAQLLGWTATTIFEEGIRCMVEHMRAQVAA